jgi:hypothetical protein
MKLTEPMANTLKVLGVAAGLHIQVPSKLSKLRSVGFDELRLLSLRFFSEHFMLVR